MGAPRHGSVLTDPGTTAPCCGSLLRKQWASTVWCCDTGLLYANQHGTHSDAP